jgi:phosphate:Na+ symporter
MLLEVDSMLVKVLRLIANPQEKLGRIADEILVSEQTVDMLEKEISEYLSQITRLETSDKQSHEILGLQHAVHDIERMGDHCESLLRLVSRRYDKKLEFSELANKEIQEIGDRTREFLELLRKSMAEPDVSLMVHARHIEQTINEMRWRMRKGHVKRLNEGSCVLNAGLVFIDMLTSFEKIGDHSFNVAQVLAGER